MRALTLLVLSMLLFLSCVGGATERLNVRAYAVEVTADVQESPPRILLSWPVDATAERYYLFRKGATETSFGAPVAVLDGTATCYVDDAVLVGTPYEYSIRKSLDHAADTVMVAAGTPVTFTIFDSWGDGMCCHHGIGWYEVRCDGVVYASGGEFGASESTSFTVGDVGGPDVEFVISVTLDVWAVETTWSLSDSGSRQTIAEGGPYEMPRFGHILAGIRCPAVEDRGAVVVLVDSDVVSGLGPEVERLETDLILDGYRVHRVVVEGSTSVPDVRDLVIAACAADPTIETLFILGRVPVPYSGNMIGSHADHAGAWPADVYYGELDGVWTDDTVNNTTPSRPANDNVPGDGKFDQSFLPSDVDLMVGRVDLWNMPAFGIDEMGLLERYLDKDHAYRRGEFVPERRGLIDDNVGESMGLAFAAFAWRNFTALFGGGEVHEADYFTTLAGQSYLYAYGCGGGSYTSCAGVGTTYDFASHAPQVVFSPLYGSYFGDWDNANNLLRAPLASEGAPLVCFWSGCPTWHLHHMALGNTIGHAARLTQNNDHEYTVSDGGRQVRVALMGDPTLKAHVVAPASDLRLDEDGGAVRLEWGSSPDVVEGYYVYRAPGLHGAFERLTTAAVGDTSYVDASPLPGSNVYMVRALKLEASASGTYYNLSGGVVDSLAVETGSAETLHLSLSFPNPAAPEVSVRFQLPSAGRALLEVFSVSGRRVRVLEDAERTAGWHTATWDGVDSGGHRAASGVYFCRLTFGGSTRTGRVTLLR